MNARTGSLMTVVVTFPSLDLFSVTTRLMKGFSNKHYAIKRCGIMS